MSGNQTNELQRYSGLVIDNSAFLSNEEQLDALQANLNSWREMNREGNKRFKEMEQMKLDLERQIQAGEEARKRLAALNQSLIVPSGSRVTSTPVSQPTTYAAQPGYPSSAVPLFVSRQPAEIPSTATIEEVPVRQPQPSRYYRISASAPVSTPNAGPSKPSQPSFKPNAPVVTPHQLAPSRRPEAPQTPDAPRAPEASHAPNGYTTQYAWKVQSGPVKVPYNHSIHYQYGTHEQSVPNVQIPSTPSMVQTWYPSEQNVSHGVNKSQTSSLAGALGPLSNTVPSNTVPKQSVNNGPGHQASTLIHDLYKSASITQQPARGQQTKRDSLATPTGSVSTSQPLPSSTQLRHPPQEPGSNMVSSSIPKNISQHPAFHTITPQQAVDRILLWSRTAACSTDWLINKYLKVFKDIDGVVSVSFYNDHGQVTSSQVLPAASKWKIPAPSASAAGTTPSSQQKSVSVPAPALQDRQPSSSKVPSPPKPDSSTAASLTLPRTSVPSVLPNQLSRTPDKANKKNMAKDILRALGRSTGKRPRADSDVSVSSKRQVVEANQVQNSQTANTAGAPSFTDSTKVDDLATDNMSLKPVSHPSSAATSTPTQSTTQHGTIAVDSHLDVPQCAPPPLLSVESMPPSGAVQNKLSIRSPSPTQQPVTSMITPTSTKQSPPTVPPIKSVFIPVESTLPAAQATPMDGVIVQRENSPLFLPSPTSSPSPILGYPATKLHFEESPNNSSNRGDVDTDFYILIPPAPKYVQQYYRQQLASQEAQGRLEIVPASRPRSRSGGADFRIDSKDASSTIAYDATEEAALECSSERLSRRPCKWRDCDVLINSTKGLFVHLQDHFMDAANEGQHTLTCHWQQCGQRFANANDFLAHLQRHALIPVGCAFEGCEESFRSVRRLILHHNFEHEDGELKSTPEPFSPTLPPSLAPVPKKLPAYMVEARAVTKAQITEQQRQTLEPWVLHNIRGPIDLDASRVAVPQKAYNFLRESRKTKRIPDLEDLDSSEVSQAAQDGLTLWGDPNSTRYPESLPLPDPVKEEDIEVPLVADQPESDGQRSPVSGAASDSEEAIISLLTQVVVE